MSIFVLAARSSKAPQSESRRNDEVERTFTQLFAPDCRRISTAIPGCSRRIRFEGDSIVVKSKARELPQEVQLEPLIGHLVANQRAEIRVIGDDGVVPAHVTAHLRHWQPWMEGRLAHAKTDPSGTALLEIPEGWTMQFLWVEPFHSYWSKVVPNPTNSCEVVCNPLPRGPFGWWHEAMGLAEIDWQRGRGIRIGVIDTGVGPHESLEHVIRVGSFIDGDRLADEVHDVSRHGTHVCGLIGARPRHPDHFVGVVPGADLFAARVFRPSAEAYQDDIANALDALVVEHSVDIVNMSLCAPVASAILRDAIQAARDAGVLCVCAAGNGGGTVRFPAALPEACAVTAIGSAAWGPPDSVAAAYRPSDPGLVGTEGRFLAEFSCYGPGVTCAAPGVGIVSTVPSATGAGGYGEMSGTSMAAPLVSGALAALLARTSSFAASPRNTGRYELAKAVLGAGCVSLGLARQYEGYGMPYPGGVEGPIY